MNTPTTEHTPAAIEATPFDDGALYDLFFERLDLGVDFYLGPARAAEGQDVDVACGTGGIMLSPLQGWSGRGGVGSLSKPAGPAAAQNGGVGIRASVAPGEHGSLSDPGPLPADHDHVQRLRP